MADEDPFKPLTMKMFQCSLCPYRTNRKNNMSKHIITMHTKMTREIRCCGSIFHSKWQVKHHNITVHSDGYHCSLCGRTFQRKDLRERHFSVHSGEKKFKCATCSYSSSHKSNLKRHWRVHRGCAAYFTHVPEIMAAPACLEMFSSPLLHTLRYSPRQPSPYLWSIEEGLRHSPLSVPTLDTHRSPVLAKQTHCPPLSAQDNDTGHRLPLFDSFVLWSSHGELMFVSVLNLRFAQSTVLC
ncbi:Zinc finger protein ZFAT [Portunus trituberculatus]|uniref:Zinc finger protein ZFAT n=1 Tax=Portunus trituberculatus TaxID=210409 RepID=A0A5B7JZM4_PORTR|nr:Zinc finger protein ZFAT [Portunus trituberculatus]